MVFAIKVTPILFPTADMIELCTDDKTINIHTNRSGRGVAGAVNNQMTDWSFKLDGILNNSTQEQVSGACGYCIIHHVNEDSTWE